MRSSYDRLQQKDRRDYIYFDAQEERMTYSLSQVPRPTEGMNMPVLSLKDFGGKSRNGVLHSSSLLLSIGKNCKSHDITPFSSKVTNAMLLDHHF